MSLSKGETGDSQGDRILTSVKRHVDRAATVEQSAERAYHVRSAAQLLLADIALKDPSDDSRSGR